MEPSLSKVARLEALFGRLVEQGGVPGLALAVVSRRGIEYARAFGVSVAGRREPFTTTTRYGIGSSSKTVTALAVLQLADRGALELSDPVHRFLPIRLFRDNSGITVHHLLCHASGIPELSGSVTVMYEIWGTEKSGLRMAGFDDLAGFLDGAGAEVVAPPGEAFRYNNDLYACLGRIVEVVTGRTFADHVREAVLAPLGMTSSGYEATGPISGHLPKDGKIAPGAFPWHPMIHAAGGIVSTVEDVTRLVRMLLEGGAVPGGRIVSEASLAAMLTPRLPSPYCRGADGGYGYGIMIERDFFGATIVHHAGNLGTSSNFYAALPDRGLGVVVGQNLDSALCQEVGRGALAVLLGASEAEAFRDTFRLDALSRLAGRYAAYRGLVSAEVKLAGGVLRLAVANGGFTSEFPLAPVGTGGLEFEVLSVGGDRRRTARFVPTAPGGPFDLWYDRYVFHRAGTPGA